MRDHGIGEVLTVDSLTVENAKPFNLSNIARLRNEESRKTMSALKQSVRCALKPFAEMIRKSGSKPLLCELAVISDKNQWQHVVALDDSREFVSIIDTYEDVLTSKLRQELIDCWKEAIRKLGISGRGDTEANYIVLNQRVYDAVTYYEKFIFQDGSPNRSAQQKTCCVNAPEAEIEHFSIDDKEKESFEDSAQEAINLLIKETLVRASDELKDALKNATLAILPFSRPYVDPAKVDEIREKDDASLSILLDPNVEKDLGGCLFAIYKNSHEESDSSDPSSAQASNLNFFLSAQYLLTLSALVEARRNLVLYYEEQRKRNWGYLVHQFKNDITQLLQNITQVHRIVEKSYELPSDLTKKFELAKGQMESMLEIADLVVKATRATASEDGEDKLFNSSIHNLLDYFKEDMIKLADLESTDLRLYGDEGKLSIKFGEFDLGDAVINGMIALKDKDGDNRSVDHIGKPRKIICHEVIKNARHYAYADSKKIKSVKCGLFSDGEWVYFICQNYIRDGSNKHGKEIVLDGAKKLQQTGGETFKFANCMGQFRVGISALHDPPDIKVKVSESSQPPVFTIAIPVGKFKSESGRHGNS